MPPRDPRCRHRGNDHDGASRRRRLPAQRRHRWSAIETWADDCDVALLFGGQLTASPVAGGDRQDIGDGDSLGFPIRTAAGPALLYTTFDPAARAPAPFLIRDLTSGETRVVLTAEESTIGGPQPVALPPGWVLFAVTLQVSPMSGSLNPEPPLLMNVDTGERISLVNLPHRTS